jgi:subtilase family serine protease
MVNPRLSRNPRKGSQRRPRWPVSGRGRVVRLSSALLMVVVSLGVLSPGRLSDSIASATSFVGKELSRASGSGLSPTLIANAYGFTSLAQRGIEGQGETILVPEAVQAGPDSLSGDATDIHQDLASFDSLFSLPAAAIRVDTSITGSALSYNANSEEVQDVEVLHAVAPEATIEILLLPVNVVSNGQRFSNAVVEMVDVSLSASWGEHYLSSGAVNAINAALKSAQRHSITFVAATGDAGTWSYNGGPREVSVPASNPLVLAVGGTTLSVDAGSGDYSGEVAWRSSNGQNASAGGFSYLYRRPAYQQRVKEISSYRGVPDVSADANSATGMTTVFGDGLNYVTSTAGGTSASTPLWAGLVALADQEAGRHLGFVNAGIYRIGQTSSYGTAFHDVATGNNTTDTSSGTVAGYRATRGWDPVTGWGSPNAETLVPLLASKVHQGDGAGLP